MDQCSWASQDNRFTFVNIKLDKSVSLSRSLVAKAFNHDCLFSFDHWIHRHPLTGLEYIIISEADYHKL
jgi:hypothetical protein